MRIEIAGVLTVLATAFVVLSMWRAWAGKNFIWLPLVASGWIFLASDILLNDGWGEDAFSALIAVLITLLSWRWWRRNRKRAPRAYGEKSRQLLAKLVEKARKLNQPRRVLRPVPNPA